MQYLEIKSFGEIDPQAFSLIGASTKRSQSDKIGFFGSGASYSLAALIKQGINFRIFSGEDEVVVTTKKTKFRDQEFEVILINGQETSLTTTMGGNDWDTAFAPIREIYSNALDEDKDASLTKTDNVSGDKGYTKFFIEMTEDVSHFYKNIHLYFCIGNPKVIFSNKTGSIYENTDEGRVRIFRKGILAHFDSNSKSLFHYNFQDIEINESRVVKYSFQINSYCAQILKSCTDKNIIERLLLELSGANSGYLEHNAKWDGYGQHFSKEWEEVCTDKRFAPIEYIDMFDSRDISGAYKLPISLLKSLKSQFLDLDVMGLGSKQDSVFIKHKPSQVLIDKVIDAISYLNNTRYKHRLDNPTIEYVKFQDEYTLGLAHDSTIYLSTKLDTHDIPSIAKIIIEENEHNITGYGDETREFQNHLFNLYYDELVSKT